MGSQTNELHQPILQPTIPPPPSTGAHSSSTELENILSDTQLPFLTRLRLASWLELKLLFRFAGPAVMMYMINNAMSLSTRMFAGHLGNLELAAATLGNSGIQLFVYGLMVRTMGINGILFMVSVGFNAAASVRVGNELGAGNPKSAAFSVVIVNLVSFIIAVVEAMVVLSLRNVISYAFTSGETVAKAVSELCPFLAATLILNGIQPVLSGVAVGCGWQAFVAYVNVGCYYFVGLPIGCVLGFKFDLGAKGIWSGMIGGTVMQTSILIWATYRTDWNKEVEKAKMRLDKWDDIVTQPLLKDSIDAREAGINGASH
ncbi:hypothetical protein C3L33_15387, partial [Rhododendron williamsianum]